MFDELNNHFLALLELELLHVLFLLTDQSSAALLTLFACRLSEGLLCALLQSSGLQSERARLGRCRHAHRALTQSSSNRAIGAADARRAILSIETVSNSSLSIVLLDTRVDTVGFERIFKRVNSVGHLIFRVLEFLLGDYVELLSLL